MSSNSNLNQLHDRLAAYLLAELEASHEEPLAASFLREVREFLKDNHITADTLPAGQATDALDELLKSSKLPFPTLQPQ